MAEYIEREAAIKRFNFAVLDCLGMESTIRAGDIIKALESIPAADVVPKDFHERCLQIEIQKRIALEKADVREVVYCKDCRHHDPEDHKCDCGGTERQGCPFKVADDYFCAYGER